MAVKLSYIPAQYRIRLECTKADVDESKNPPEDLIERATARLQKDVDSGKIAFFRVFETRLNRVWQAVRNSEDPPKERIAVTVATGAPAILGVRVADIDDDEALACLTISAPKDEVAKWRFPVFKITVGKKLRDIGIMDVADPARIHGAWLRACQGELIDRFPLYPLPEIPKKVKKDLSFHLVHDEENGEVSLIVYNVADLVDDLSITKMLRTVRSEISELEKSAGRQFQVLAEDMARTLRSAHRGPERYGIDLPLVLLAAIKSDIPIVVPQPVRGDARGASANRGSQVAQTQVGRPIGNFIELEISEDLMQVRIKKFDERFYEDHDSFQKKAWQKLVEAAGIHFGFDDEKQAELKKAIHDKMSLDGFVLAEGVKPVQAKKPKLVESYKNVAIGSGDQVDLRKLQQRSMVKAGALVAEISWANDEIIGSNVCGKAIHPEKAEMIEVTAGEGIETKDGQKFYATQDGIPEVTGNAVNLNTDLFLVEGDVDLTSGHIDYDGPVEINGNIDTGSVVLVQGDLRVNGSILGGIVKVKGTITCQGGILGNPHSIVQSGGNVSCEFIENADVRSAGDVFAKNAIVSSKVIAKDRIEVTEDGGLIAGGLVSCMGEVKTTHLGREGGSTTQLIVGGSYLREVRLANCASRIARIEAFTKTHRASWRELKRRRPEQLTKRHHKMLADFDQKLARSKELIGKLTELESQLKGKPGYNEDAIITVMGTLAKNCHVRIAGKRVTITEAVVEVQILPKRIKGSYIAPVGAAEEQKKAS